MVRANYRNQPIWDCNGLYRPGLQWG